VRRFLIAAGLAVIMHGVFLSMEPGWLKKRFVFKHRPEAITLTLAFHEPQVPKSKPVIKRPDTPQKRTDPVRKPQKVKRAAKPVSRRPVKPIVASKPEPAPEPEKYKVTGKTPDIKRDKAKYISKEEEIEEIDEMVSVSPSNVVSEAKPVYRRTPPPNYPKLARKRGYQGTVILEVLVDRGGRAAELRIITSTGYPILDRAAVKSVKNWLFEPGMRGNRKVEMWVRVPIRFQLK